MLFRSDFHRAIDPGVMAGDLMACSYLATEPASQAEGFSSRFQARYGANRTVTDSMAAAYSAVLLWAKAAEAAKADTGDAVLRELPKIEVASPFGALKTVETGRHFRFPLITAEFMADGSTKVVHRSEAIDANVYPGTRSHADWDRFLRQLYFRWGERWRGPDSTK